MRNNLIMCHLAGHGAFIYSLLYILKTIVSIAKLTLNFDFDCSILILILIMFSLILYNTFFSFPISLVTYIVLFLILSKYVPTSSMRFSFLFCLHASAFLYRSISYYFRTHLEKLNYIKCIVRAHMESLISK